MMLGDFHARLNNLLGARGVNPGNGGEADERDLERYLSVLRYAPQPDLARGKARVLAAARAQAQERVPVSGSPRRVLVLAGAWAGIAFAIFLLAMTMLLWNGGGSGNSFWGQWATGTLTSTELPSLQTAVIGTDAPAITINPTPVESAGVRAIPVQTPEPAVAPTPVRSPQITLTRAAPPTINP